MAVDFKYFPFSPVFNRDAPTLTGALVADPVKNGFIVISFKANDIPTFIAKLNQYFTGFDKTQYQIQSIKIFRQLLRTELGGIVPFDQHICERYIDKPPCINFLVRWIKNINKLSDIVLNNRRVNVVVLIELTDHTAAIKLHSHLLNQNTSAWKNILDSTKHFSIDVFENLKRYSEVSTDNNKIQFFNFFPKPGNLKILWDAWQDALPWFFEVGEMRSSFPLRAFTEEQNYLLINYAHCDSTKHFLVNVAYDVAFKELMVRCYIKRKVTLPLPFFCKIVATL